MAYSLPPLILWVIFGGKGKRFTGFLAIGEFVQLFWMDGSATNLPVTFMN